MKTTEYILKTINRFPKRYIFTYKEFVTDTNKEEAVIKALNRMTASGKINKLCKGKFYKPEYSEFGYLAPSQYQIVKDLLTSNGKTTGYLTGFSIYNSLGLTTQVSNTIQIGKNDVRPKFKRDRYIISFIKQKNTITKENTPLLQILDTIRYIKKIPDTTIDVACVRLLSILREQSEKDRKALVKLAKKYLPYTRALLGALLDETGDTLMTDPLLQSLNPITKYKIPLSKDIVSSTVKWNII